MRKELKLLDGERNVFTGEFVRFGTKLGYKGIERTVLLKNITNSLVKSYILFNFAAKIKEI